jgi:hypothetical protein
MTAARNGYDPADRILAHWYFPGALTAVGLYRVIRADSGVGRGVGGLLAAIGLWWIASEAYGFRFNIWHWWPLAIVAFGVMMILRAIGESSADAPGAPGSQSGFGAPPFPPTNPFGEPQVAPASAGVAQAPAGPVVDMGPVSAFAFWSGVHRRVSSAFKRANLAAFMGGIELDLRPAVTVGGQAVIDVFVVMGGLEITVPPDWTVANEALVIMGGIDDRSSGSAGASQTLIIRGFILMGGVEIKT